MSNGFSFYEGATTDGATNSQVTVRKGGQLALTQAAVAMLGDDVTDVQVGFNPKTRAIGLRASDDGAKGRYRLRSQKNSTRRLVDAKRLFALHGLTIEKAATLDAEAFGDGIVGVVLLAAASDASNSKPNPASSRKPTRSRAA